MPLPKWMTVLCSTNPVAVSAAVRICRCGRLPRAGRARPGVVGRPYGRVLSLRIAHENLPDCDQNRQRQLSQETKTVRVDSKKLEADERHRTRRKQADLFERMDALT